MNYIIFDDYKIARKYEGENKVLINEPTCKVKDDVLYDVIIAQSNESFPLRIFAFFTSQNIENYDYKIITEYPKQYQGVVADSKIKVWEKDKEVDFESELIDLVGKGFAELPLQCKSENSEIVPKTEDDILSEENLATENGRVEANYYLADKIYEMEQYLKDTDWYVSRFIETQEVIPSEVSQQRKVYREKISQFRVQHKKLNE